jgi:hypothetical protein
MYGYVVIDGRVIAITFIVFITMCCDNFGCYKFMD